MKLKFLHIIPFVCGTICILLLSSNAFAQPVYISGPPIAVDLANDPNPKIVDLSAQTGGQPIIFAYLSIASNYGTQSNTNIRVDNDPSLSFSGTNLIINWVNSGSTAYWDGTAGAGPWRTSVHISWFVVTGNTTLQYEGGSALIPWPACSSDITHWSNITAAKPVIFAYAATGSDRNFGGWGRTSVEDIRWGVPTPETVGIQMRSFRSFAGCNYNRYVNWFAFTEP